MNTAQSFAILKIVLRLLIIFVIIQLLRSVAARLGCLSLSLLGLTIPRGRVSRPMALWRCYISLCPWRLVVSHFECNLDDRRIPQILRHIEGRRYLTFAVTGARRSCTCGSELGRQRNIDWCVGRCVRPTWCRSLRINSRGGWISGHLGETF